MCCSQTISAVGREYIIRMLCLETISTVGREYIVRMFFTDDECCWKGVHYQDVLLTISAVGREHVHLRFFFSGVVKADDGCCSRTVSQPGVREGRRYWRCCSSCPHCGLVS